ncbi:hypothetical protein JKF63_04706 [Porcisia hertigi]|uniref:Protein kinase domain-containing protein n=1 Tax=Porcisia hertigi TaxID=2761500 RepID=A0A836ITQ7_9TRYP|nr:hypothetical protein JKF63_04706 [Porcisia hertigi]
MEAVVKLNRKLGVGSRGVVYEGFDRATGHFVAIKELSYMRPSTPDEEDTELASILSELACMRDAQHPNLVKYYGARWSAVGIQIIMEHVSGGSLDYVLTRCGPLREHIARAYTRDVLEALHYLHKTMHVCHRDVKPANILITSDGRCKLADFGVAKHVVTVETPTCSAESQEDKRGVKESTTLRHSNGERQCYLQTAVGTPWYMAPEVINGGVDDDDDDGESVDPEDARAVMDSGSANNDSLGEGWMDSGVAHAPPKPSASPQPLYSSSPSYYNPLKKILKKGRLGARSVGYTTSADIWSVGVTVYEMITGTKPFGADLCNPSAVLFRIANCAASPPQLPASVHVSAELHNFLDLCFVYDKDLRATAEELLSHPWLQSARKVDRSGAVSTRVAEQPPCPLSNNKDLSRSDIHVEDGEPVKRHQKQVARRTVFDGVPLLDSVDLPPYPTTIAVSSSVPSPRAEAIVSVGATHPTRVILSEGGQSSFHRLSNSSTHCVNHSVLHTSPAIIAPPPSCVSHEEQSEASSRYAAVRHRIGHTRAANSARTATSAPPPTVQSSGSGLWSKNGEFVDLLTHR